MNYLLRLCLIGMVLCFVGFSLVTAQEKRRLVEIYPYDDPPIEVIGIQVGDKIFDRSHIGYGDENWLKNLRLTVKNVSSKHIRSSDMVLHIDKQGQMLTSVSFPILFRTYTKATPENALTQKGEKKLGTFRPGEILHIQIGDPHLKAFGKHLQGEDVSRARLYLQSIFFDDESTWAFGKYSRVMETESPPGIHTQWSLCSLGALCV